MEDDLIVVDDIDTTDNQPGSSAASNGLHSRPKSVAEHAMATSRLRSGSNPPPIDNSERSTRSSTAKSKPQPKLKLKLSEKTAAQAPGMSFLGPYDRELDSDDEDLTFEEQFILRLAPGEDLEKLRKMAASREVSPDVWFKFKDSRRAVFHIGENAYSAKLVDLPCIIESQKTLDNKQMFKVADICQVDPPFSPMKALTHSLQMLVVEDRLETEEQAATRKDFNIDEFIWPHGVTPPLHHVRKRRFRKRLNRRMIETVEQEVERLLDEDALAAEVKYEVLENVNPDLSDSEFLEREEPIDAPTPAISDVADAATPGSHLGEDDDEDEEGEEENEDIDEELAAQLELSLEDEQAAAENDEYDDEDEDDDDDESEEDDDEDDEEAQARKLLNAEIRDLEAAVAKKQTEISSSVNPLIRKRFEDALKKLTVDLEMKQAQREEMTEKLRMKKEGIVMDTAEDTDAGHDGGIDDEGDDDLFGDGGSMDIG
ncbi:TAFII55 protein conserved region-domain-containing protein [Cyathus striatus]|nr:TAFII55 protein conserved region-domain-containing protein [Cyathus striatus]